MQAGPGETTTSIFPSVVTIGGEQPDVSAARNLCTSAGVRGPDGAALSEAMAFGLAGGIGFLYGVFDYEQGPTMTIVARNKSMPDPFCEPLFDRCGARIEIATTGGSKKAAASLDAMIDREQPALCTIGAGIEPHVVGVVGSSASGALLIDDRESTPILAARDDFDEARAAVKAAKHRMISIIDVDPSHDWPVALRNAVAAGASGFDTPPVPQFASNVGLLGLRKFERLLTDPKDSKGWCKVFGSGHRAAIGLSRLHDCVERDYTTPAAGRPLHADFLDEAAAVTGVTRWLEAAEHLRSSGALWSQIATIAADSDLTVQAAVIDGQRDGLGTCELTAERATQVFASIAELVSPLIAHEEAALDLLRYHS